MRMFEYWPSSPEPGIPSRRPVMGSSDAQGGGLAIEKVSASSSGSLADGTKAYSSPTVADDEGAPEIVGARFSGAAAVTVIENAGRDAVALPSLTVIRMFECVPTCPAPGMPSSWPVDGVNDSHAGRFTMLNDSESPSASLADGVKT